MPPVFTPFTSFAQPQPAVAGPEFGVVTGAIQLAQNKEHPTYPWSVGLFSILCHGLLVLLVFLTLFILDFLGIEWMAFNPMTLTPQEIQFVLVDVPEQPPRDPNTKNRADRASRSGGEKADPKATTLPQRKAGSTAAKPTPTVRPQQPSPKPAKQQPRQATPRKQPKKAQQQPPKRPTPPRPSTSTPKPTSRPVAPPSPIAPTIKTPAPPTPNGTRGPVLPSPTGSSSGRSSSNPTQITGGYGAQRRPGQVGSPGNVGGSNGTGSTNRYGATGGGGGAPGIDALPDPDYGAYMAELQRRIKRNWRPPKAQEDKRVVVLFRIARDGRLLSLDIKTSSGYSEADAAAKAAVRLSSPFRPLPAGHREADLPVEFTFDYNVYRSR